MTHRHDAPEPIEYDDLHVPARFLTMYRVPIDAEAAPGVTRPEPSIAFECLVRVLAMAIWAGLLWLLGWYITDAKGGFVVAVIGGVAALPYLVMTCRSM